MGESSRRERQIFRNKTDIGRVREKDRKRERQIS